MKTGFRDPIAPKRGEKKKSPWDYRCPSYDERTSCYVNVGSHYGIGHKNPVGHKGDPKMRISTLPFGKVSTMEVDQVPVKNLDQEYVE